MGAKSGDPKTKSDMQQGFDENLAPRHLAAAQVEKVVGDARGPVVDHLSQFARENLRCLGKRKGFCPGEGG